MQRGTSMMYKYLFGPIQSRRLGRSLGINLLCGKICNFNCVYCECGRTERLTGQRAEYVPRNEVIAELTDFLTTGPKLDYITYAGSGEPLLHNGIGEITAFLKDNFPLYKVALLTNGAVFVNHNVIDEAMQCDLIVPSLDAVSPDIFNRVVRPLPGTCPDAVIEGLVMLRKKYSGALWLEIFIVPGVNDTKHELLLLASAAKRISPDRVQLNSLDRKGTEAWVKPIGQETLHVIAAKYFGAFSVDIAAKKDQ